MTKKAFILIAMTTCAGITTSLAVMISAGTKLTVRTVSLVIRTKHQAASAREELCSGGNGVCQTMKGFLHFFRTTLVGGILFLVPIVVLIIVLNKALAIAHKLVDPIAARLPFESLIGLCTPHVLAITLLLIFCFVAGLFARTALAKRSVNWLESAVLSNVPRY